MEKRADKNLRLEGLFCRLTPVTEKELPLIVNLRNREKNKYFLNQKSDITLKMQEEWFLEYQKRENDIYLGIRNRNNVFIGTIRLYNIEGDTCEEGSCIVDERYAREAPYAAEAKYLLTQYAFHVLGMQRMINEIRVDNKVMKSLARQQGFLPVKQVEIGGAMYCYMVLDADRYSGERLKRILDNWKERETIEDRSKN